jgi:ubiquinone/menaquinone biosynthesis C-methylase UbiE
MESVAETRGEMEMTAQLIDRGPASAVEPTPLSPAEIYELFAVPALFEPAAHRLLAAARPLSGERVLDVGTGTGIVARRVAPLVGATGAVTGLDANAGMLHVARIAAAKEGLSIAWQHGAAEQLPFPEGTFDLVLSQFALMFFSDIPTALAEMWRVLAPGGRVALSVFQGIERHPFYGALDQAIAGHLGRSTVAAIFSLGDSGALGEALSRAGFRDVVIEPLSTATPMGPPEMFLAGELEIDAAALPAMQDLTPAARQELAAVIAAEMAEPLRSVTNGGQVVMEFHTHIACAHR